MQHFFGLWGVRVKDETKAILTMKKKERKKEWIMRKKKIKIKKEKKGIL